MLTVELIKKDNQKAVYKYFPEGREPFGVVEISNDGVCKSLMPDGLHPFFI